jgi:hypothetical protein
MKVNASDRFFEFFVKGFIAVVFCIVIGGVAFSVITASPMQTHQIVTIDGCEYIRNNPFSQNESLIHKANCKNCLKNQR